MEVQRLHPLEAGVLRRKYRLDRRPAMPREGILTFYPRMLMETIVKLVKFSLIVFESYRIHRRVRRDADRSNYTDLAITPPSQAELDTLDLFNETSGGTSAVEKKRSDDERRERVERHAAAE